MIIGKLRHRVAFERCVETRNELGEATKQWAAQRQAWASIEPATAREVLLRGAAVAQVTHVVRTRFQRDVAPASWRIRYRGRVFAIAGAVNVDERDVEHQFLCYETDGEQR